MTEVFDILLNPDHGQQMLRTQLQIKLPEPSFTNFGKNGEITTECFICSEHFGESDFAYHIDDKSYRRKWKLQKEKRKYIYVKKGGYPIKFPNFPSYLPKKKPAERPSLGFSDAREKISTQRLECKPLSELEARTLRSINDLCSFLN